MIRVTKSEERERTVITIDGHLSGDYVEVVEIFCNQAASEGKPIDVFLHDVLTIDESGRALLTRLAAKGIRLLATGMYTSYLVRDPRGSRFPGVRLSIDAADAGGERTSPKSERGHG
jgi:hypothetical protein